jgi:hypothetical protein
MATIKMTQTATIQDEFERACDRGDLATVNRLIDHPSIDPFALSHWFSEYCNETETSPIIVWVCYQGDLAIARRLLQDFRFDPAAQRNSAIRLASGEGRADIVALLLQDVRVDPSAKDNEAIRLAAEERNAGVVHLLLNDHRVDPTAQKYAAFQSAYFNCDADIMALLLHDERVDPSKVLEYQCNWKDLTYQGAECEDFFVVAILPQLVSEIKKRSFAVTTQGDSGKEK